MPYVAVATLSVIILATLLADVIAPYDPGYMDLSAISTSPGKDHVLGTDTMGRDLFSAILYGGRISLVIGIAATGISTLIAILYGTIAGLAPAALDDVLMRFTEIIMSIPSILLVIFIQAAIGDATVFSIIIVIGATAWPSVAKIVRNEVKQIRNRSYVLAAKAMGGSFFYILRKHLMPGFMSTIMFMIVSNIGSAIMTEATLSFLGLGLPLDELSWGSLLSISQRAILSGAWWILLIPGTVLTVTLICIMDVGEYLRVNNKRGAVIARNGFMKRRII